MNKVFKFYRDSTGHGYLATKMKLLRELDLLNSVSSLSRMKGQTVYLDNGMDLLAFTRVYEAKYGVLATKDVVHGGRSWVKNMQKYSVATNVPVNGENPDVVANASHSER